MDFQPPPANQTSVAIASILADSRVASVVTSRDPTRQFLHPTRQENPSRCEKIRHQKANFTTFFANGNPENPKKKQPSILPLWVGGSHFVTQAPQIFPSQVAGWNDIPIFSRIHTSSFRGPHFPASYVSL